MIHAFHKIPTEEEHLLSEFLPVLLQTNKAETSEAMPWDNAFRFLAPSFLC